MRAIQAPSAIRLPRRIWFAGFVLAALVQGSGAARGYEGGPGLVEVIGWDERAQRIYLLEYPPFEGGCFISYFALGSATPEQERRASEAFDGDVSKSPRLRALRARLKPLSYQPFEVLSGEVAVTRHDSVDVPNGRFARFQIEARYRGEFEGLRFRLLSFGHEFVIKDVYRIPGREDYLFIVSFHGNPYGMFEETQVPVVILKGKRDRVHEISWQQNQE